MFTRPTHRRLASSAALVVTIGGLSLLAAPAQADVTLGACAVNVDSPTRTITLTADCDTYETLQAPDGWTVDGAGHTITAVQDQDHQSFTGAVLASAVGDDSAPATLNVKNLTITSRGFDQYTQDVLGHAAIGISMVRAGGDLTDVTVDGIAHATGQLTRAIYVSNTNGGSTDVPRADVTLNRVTASRWQKSGVFLQGNLGYVAQHLNVPQSENVDGSKNLLNASNGIVLIDGAHGSISDSTLGENRYPADDGGAAEDVTSATSILLQNAGRTTLARNVIEGTDGDVGVLVYNDSNNINTSVSMSCSTLIDHDGGHRDANQGFGVWNYEDNTPGSVDLTVASNTFSGWTHNIQGDATESSDPACSTSNTLTPSATQVQYGSTVSLTGMVSNSDGSAPTGTATLQRREAGSTTWTDAGTKDVASNGKYSFQVMPKQKTSYRTKFTGDTFTSSVSKAVTVGVTPRVGVRVNDATPKRKATVSITGSVAPNQAGAVAALQQLQQGHWVTVQSDTVSSTSTFDFSWQAPNSAAKSSYRVHTSATPSLAEGNSRTVVITVR